MANSISSRQKQVVDSGFLDLMGETNFKPVTFSSVQDSLILLAIKYIETATNNLNRADKTSGGKLADSIVASPVIINGSLYQINVSLADYYKFVDQGVDGWAKGYGSPFKFKHYTGKSGKKDSKFIKSLQAWLLSNAKQISTTKTPITAREKAQKSIKDASLTTAIIISRSIRKKGLKPTHFWSDTVKSVQPEAERLFGEAIKIDIINNIINGNRN